MAVIEHGGDGAPERFAATRAPLEQARHLPGYLYSAPDLYAAEKERIFLKDWLCVARVEEIERPGDFMTFRILDEPIVVARNRAGELNAFANVCAHRGVEVAAGAGNTAEFSCPYHGWLYDLDGRLVGAPYMKEAEGFDPAVCRLKPLRLAEWAGWIFVSFDADGAPFADHIAGFDKAFAPIRQQDCRLADKLVVDLECNWKFMIENFVDFYHVGVLHTETLGGIPCEEIEFDLKDRGGFVTFYPHPPMYAGGKLLFEMMPAIADRPHDYSAAGFLAPNKHLFVYGDNVQVAHMWPLAPGRSRIVVYSLFPEPFFARDDFEEKLVEHKRLMRAIVEEDRDMLTSLQRAMASRNYVPGPMSPRLERTIHHLVNHNLDRVFGAD